MKVNFSKPAIRVLKRAYKMSNKAKGMTALDILNGISIDETNLLKEVCGKKICKITNLAEGNFEIDENVLMSSAIVCAVTKYCENQKYPLIGIDGILLYLIDCESVVFKNFTRCSFGELYSIRRKITELGF